MANANQSANRAGSAFGREYGAGYAGNDWENIVLKPGYILKIRDRFHLVEAVEGLTVDLFFNDNFTYTIASSQITAANDGALLHQYGNFSMQAILGTTTDDTHSNIRANMLKPSFDSGYIEFKDLEPYRGHLYHLCPSVPTQPKYADADGEWLSKNGTLPSDGGIPIGFGKPSLVTADVSSTPLKVTTFDGLTNVPANGTIDQSGVVGPTPAMEGQLRLSVLQHPRSTYATQRVCQSGFWTRLLKAQAVWSRTPEVSKDCPDSLTVTSLLSKTRIGPTHCGLNPAKTTCLLSRW